MNMVLIDALTETRIYRHPVEPTTDSSEDTIWIFGKNKEVEQNNIKQLSLISLLLNSLQIVQIENQAFKNITTYAEQNSNLLIELLNVRRQIEEDFLYEYNYHIKPIRVKTLVGNFEFAGKGKTKFHFDNE